MIIRYFLIQKLYPLLSLLIHFYFLVVNRIFGILNSWKPKTKVEWTREELYNELLFLSAKKAAEKIRKKEITSEQLVSAYIARIKRVQPLVNAVVVDCFESALEEAKAVDRHLAGIDEQSEEFRNLAQSKPLLGVPFTNKNNMDAKGIVTVAGHKKFLDNPPAEKDAIVVERLRAAGAILLAITNLPKLAMNWCTENDVHGRTSNPYDLRRIAGGSSGGEGALIAAGGSLFGLGNDLGGSVRIPAFMCGLFGLKPTKDAVPLDGFVPPLDLQVARDQWSIGPLCRYAEDLPIVFGIIAGKSLAQLEWSVDFSGLNLFYMDQLNILLLEPVHENMRNALKKSVHFFETEFGLTAQKVDFPLAHHLYEIWGALGFGEPAKSIAEIMTELPKLTKGESDMTSCAWAMELVHNFVATRDRQEKEFMLDKLERLRRQVGHLLSENGLLLMPAWSTVAPFHGQPLFTPFNFALTQLINILGFPSLVCPIGLDPGSGMPLGVQLIGQPNSEPLLMAAAREMERREFSVWERP